MKYKVFLLFLTVFVLCFTVCLSSVEALTADEFHEWIRAGEEEARWREQEEGQKYQQEYERDLKEFLNGEFDSHGYEATVKLRNGTVLHGYILNKYFETYILSRKQDYKFPLSKISSFTLRNLLSDKITLRDGTEFKVYLNSRFVKFRYSYNNEIEILETFHIKSFFFGW
jgi:uncharacterized protein YxeA